MVALGRSSRRMRRRRWRVELDGGGGGKNDLRGADFEVEVPRVTAPLVIIVSEALARPGDETGGGAGWLSGNGRRGESIDGAIALNLQAGRAGL
jgi:hypothetical protein